MDHRVAAGSPACISTESRCSVKPSARSFICPIRATGSSTVAIMGCCESVGQPQRHLYQEHYDGVTCFYMEQCAGQKVQRDGIHTRG